MPLHDWTDETGWENFRGFWIFRLADSLQPRLPEGYRVYTGSYSQVGLAMATRPDVGVAAPVQMSPPNDHEAGEGLAPDDEAAIATVEPGRSVYVQYRGLMVVAIELVSPRNKDRPSARAASIAKYAGYLRGGINLVLVDLLPQPAGFSFADAVSTDIELPNQPPVPVPFAVAYRVGEQAPVRGSYVAVWRRPLAAGQPLPSLPLPLTVHRQIMLDLEVTYMQAAANAYLA